MKTLFTIKCNDGATRFVFCRSRNSRSPLTNSEIIPTEDKRKAYAAYSSEGVANSLKYFTQHANGAGVAVA